MLRLILHSWQQITAARGASTWRSGSVGRAMSLRVSEDCDQEPSDTKRRGARGMQLATVFAAQVVRHEPAINSKRLALPEGW
jgi:hypothetical protein